MRKVFYAGDKQPFVLYVQDQNGNPINGTGWTVQFRFEQGDGVGKEITLTPIDPTNPKGAKFQYVTQPTEMVPGNMLWEWTVIDPSDVPVVTGPSPRRHREVVARIPVP